jgi:hypothetical protein
MGLVVGPEYVVTSALSGLNVGAGIIPFNLVLSGNAAGIAALNTSTGVFTVPKSGLYSLDFNVQFTANSGVLGGSSLTVNVCRFASPLTSMVYQYPFAGTAATTNSINGNWSGNFLAGDEITLQTASTITVVYSISGSSLPGVMPFITMWTVRSDF